MPGNASEHLKRLLAELKAAAAAFFNLDGQDDAAQTATKVASTAGRRAAYALADYWLAALSALLVIGMKASSFDFALIFAALWAFDLAIAGAFVLIWKATGHDLSLGEDFRRAVDVIASNSRPAGAAAMAVVLIQATFWSGPEQVVIFFRKELRSGLRTTAVLLALTAVQAFVWALAYSLGYESVSEVINYVRGARAGSLAP